MKSKTPSSNQNAAPAKAKTAATLRDLPVRKDPRGGRKNEQNDK